MIDALRKKLDSWYPWSDDLSDNTGFYDKDEIKPIVDQMVKVVEALSKLPLSEMRKHGIAAEVRSLGIEIMQHNPKPQPGDWMGIDTQRLKDFCSLGEYAAQTINTIESELSALERLVGE